MSDSNYSYMEVSAKRKKRNQFISALIIVAIVLVGVVIWGWMELQKSRNAERIKNALNSQIEPGFQESDTIVSVYADTGGLLVEDAPERPHETPPIEEPPIVAIPSAPRKNVEPKVDREKAAAPVALKPKPKSNPEPVAKEDKTEIPPVAMHTPPSEAAKPVTPPPIKEPPRPAKAFEPEDLPVPATPEVSDDAKQALGSSPKVEKTAQEDLTNSSTSFKTGMNAYQQSDFVNAIRSFASVPKPATKRRGSPDRDEFVKANFFRGLSLQKVGHLSEAVSAYKNVLEYEKYYPVANMNLGICYVELKQYAKAHQAFDAVVRDQSFIEPGMFDDVMQRTKYFWALAWTRLYKNSNNADKKSYYKQQAILKWKDYQIWFAKNEKFKSENLRAENYLRSLQNI